MKYALALLAIVASAAFVTTATAHDPNEFDLEAQVDDCRDPAATTWSVVWTLSNDEGENPFGIVDSEVNGSNVTFSPLVDDQAPGMYIPDGESASVTTTHNVSVASAEIIVTHDVSNGPDTEHDLTVDRPPLCAATVTDDASITVRKVVANSSNDTTNFNVDFSAGVTDIVNIDENDAPVRRGDLVPGLYILTEYSVPAGYQFVSWVCESDQLGADVDTNNSLMDVSLLVRAGEDFFCVLTNEPKPATATPTATAVPATATPVVATATPAPTAAPVIPNIIVNPPNVTVNIPPSAPVAAQQPAATAPVLGTAPRITAPSTGSGGLLP